jgi:hypothetical protein
MRTLACSFVLVLVACASRPPVGDSGQAAHAVDGAEIDLELAGPAEVYHGEQGIQVTLVPVVSDEGDKVLIEISGVRSEIADVVLMHERIDRGNNRWEYRTTLQGRHSYTLTTQERHGALRGDVYLPSSRGNARRVLHDSASSAEVDGDALVARHAAQLADGTIAELERFNRAEREAAQDQRLATEFSAAYTTCETEVPAEIAWATVSDERLKVYAVSNFCGAVAGGLRDLCRFPAGRDLVQQRVEAIRCEFGETSRVDLSDDGLLTWTVDPETANAERLARDLVRTRFGRDRVVLRAQGPGFYLTLDPGDANVPVHFSEDGETFYEHAEVRPSGQGHQRWLFAGGARSVLDHQDGAWSLACGEDEVALTELPPERVEAFLSSRELGDHRWRREPYALARDDRGRYYYIDRFKERYGGKGFRVFQGRQGALSLTQLVDIVNDSQGMVFSTDSGDLRLIVDDRRGLQQATWYRGDARTELRVLSVHENAELVFQELGVYVGENLGTVCELL